MRRKVFDITEFLSREKNFSINIIGNVLKRLRRLEKALFSGMIGEVLIKLKEDILRNCKQKRKRKTVPELVLQQIPYYGKL